MGLRRHAIDNFGQMWVAGHANLVDWRAMADDPGKRASSQLFRVRLMNGVPQAVEQVYGNNGTELAGASVGMPAANRLLIGSSLDNRLLDCPPK